MYVMSFVSFVSAFSEVFSKHLNESKWKCVIRNKNKTVVVEVSFFMITYSYLHIQRRMFKVNFPFNVGFFNAFYSQKYSSH